MAVACGAAGARARQGWEQQQAKRQRGRHSVTRAEAAVQQPAAAIRAAAAGSHLWWCGAKPSGSADQQVPVWVRRGESRPVRVAGGKGTWCLSACCSQRETIPPKTQQPVRCADVQGKNTLIGLSDMSMKTHQPPLS